jgi:hypothetical protein
MALLIITTNNRAREDNMQNNTKRDYQIKRTELFGGDINLQQLSNRHRPMMAQSCCCMKSACACDSCCDAASTIQAEEELAGLYWYSIDQAFLLSQSSTFSLPFVQANIKLEKYSQLQIYFHEQTQKENFQRKYRIESDRFLPKENLTVREDGHVVGQVHLNDLSQGEKQDSDFGNDLDVSYQHQVTIESKKRNSARYQIRLTIKNGKTKSIKYEILLEY